MGNFIITKQDGGLKRQSPSEFMKTGMLLGAVTAPGLALNVLSDEFTRLDQIEALGITADYDTTNEILVWYHAKEFFRMSPSGKLRIMLVPQGTTMADMCSISESYVQKMVEDSPGDLRRIGVVLNPDDGYVSTLSGGFDQDVTNAIDNAQVLANQAFADKRPVQILIEGREFNGTVPAMSDFRSDDFPDVYITAIQDSEAMTEYGIDLHLKSAAVGSTLGAMSFVEPNESIGWTAKVNLSDKTSGEFATVGLSSNALASTIETDYQTMTDKGIIFGRNYPSQAGVYFNDYPSLALLTSDYAYGQEVAVINEASRRLYDALFPRINGPVKIDPDTGKIQPETAAVIEAEGYDSLEIMVQQSHISGMDVYVDPDQDVQTTGILEVQFSLVSIATGRTIKASIGFTKKIG